MESRIIDLLKGMDDNAINVILTVLKANISEYRGCKDIYDIIYNFKMKKIRHLSKSIKMSLSLKDESVYTLATHRGSAVAQVVLYENVLPNSFQYDPSVPESIYWKLIESCEITPSIGNMFGKPAKMNRCVGFFADPEKIEGYRYSGQISRSQQPPSFLKDLLNDINNVTRTFRTDTEFNASLVNVYRSGEEYISQHSDDERALADGVVVALSLGATRTFRIERTKTKGSDIEFSIENMNIELPGGSLLIMRGSLFHQLYTHGLPKRLRVKMPRLSITFRHHSH